MSYEALCLELLGVLKRGFTAQVGVRMSLYQGILLLSIFKVRFLFQSKAVEGQGTPYNMITALY